VKGEWRISHAEQLQGPSSSPDKDDQVSMKHLSSACSTHLQAQKRIQNRILAGKHVSLSVDGRLTQIHVKSVCWQILWWIVGFGWGTIGRLNYKMQDIS
jgi:hypothetical protein